MSPRYSERLVKAVAVTAELCGTALSQDAARIMVDDLSGYPEEQVLPALTRCRREVKGRLTIAEIVSRLEDGRPGPEEAWAMLPRDEESSAVMTQEMAEAFGVVNALIAEDAVAARVAFREAYAKLVQQARDRREPPHWFPSLGADPTRRTSALAEAVRRGRLTIDHAQSLVAIEQRPALLSLIATDKPGRPEIQRDAPNLAAVREQIDGVVKRISA